MDDQVLQTIIIGISNGLIYALVALGYTLVYGIIELINFAHGDVFMLGSMMAFTLLVTFGVSSGADPLTTIGLIIVVLLITMALSAALNVSIERVAYRPLRHAPRLAPLISAIGMSFVLQNVGLLWKGPSNLGYPDVIPNVNVLTTVFGLDTGVSLSYKQLFTGVVTIPLLIGLSWFVSKTRQGKAMRATAQDREASGLMGIDVNRTISLTFLIAGALAGAAGLVVALYYGQTFFQYGLQFGLLSFTAAVLGGIGNLTGATLGGLFVGIVAAMSDRFIEAKWTSVIVFSLLILVLIFRPTGLLAEQQSERA
jgi:branched-chain amino acid transport system permease protein